MEPLTFITEPLLSDEFVQYRAIAPLGSWLSRRFDVTVASPYIAPTVERRLEDVGIEAVSGAAWFPPLRHARDEIPSYVASWGRDSLLGLNGRRLGRLLKGRSDLRVNMSMTSAVAADVWYIQGRPIGPTLQTIGPSLRRSLRLMSEYLGPTAGMVDHRHMRAVAHVSQQVYANSESLRSWFLQHGIPVQGVLPNYFYPVDFAPTTNNPRRDYVLVYMGKETEMNTVRSLAQSGLPIKVFGGKSGGWIQSSRGSDDDPNIEVMGRVSHDELKDLYSNALFTAFPFTEEPFGLVPVESMACGTPVLTYARQGPGETVLDGLTGWLVDNPTEFRARSQWVWQNRFPSTFTRRCVNRASEFRLDAIAGRWERVIRKAFTQRSTGREPSWPGQLLPSQRMTPSH